MKHNTLTKLITLALAAVLALSLAACGSKTNTDNGGDTKTAIKIGVPNDTTNEARALTLLEKNGFFKLKADAGLTATKNDIEENPLNVTVDEVEAIMNKAGIPNQTAFVPADIDKSAQYAARHDIATWTDSVYGEMKGIGITNKFKKNPAQIVASAPTFGEHSREVLEFLGYTEAQIDDMYAKGVTATIDPRETAIQLHLMDRQFFLRVVQAEKLVL